MRGRALCSLGQHSTVEPRSLPLDFPLFCCVITFSSSAGCLQICVNKKIFYPERFAFLLVQREGKAMKRCPAIIVSEKKGQPWKQEAPFLSRACHPLLQAWNGCNFNPWRPFFERYTADSPIADGYKVVSLSVQSEIRKENCALVRK